ncbi:hypothetical protein RAM_33845 [Amycolatopsis mediterranei S699]|uniref:Uncharacterized protein n=1 Tax=Amycolatopsis mediterranei (strain S699) TaxID=713604 RepID=A0A9R0P2T1_AMYMS|nr:hypothetical protein RAM_33845 [Amycolatopsis mediterranei S699]
MPPAPEPREGPKRWAWQDSAITGGFLLFTILLYNGLWFDLKRGYLWNGGADQSQWEWYSTVVAKPSSTSRTRSPRTCRTTPAASTWRRTRRCSA